MLKLIARACRRLHIIYLKYRIAQAEIDACVIQADAMTAPARLIRTRSYITDLHNKIADLEATP